MRPLTPGESRQSAAQARVQPQNGHHPICILDSVMLDCLFVHRRLSTDTDTTRITSLPLQPSTFIPCTADCVVGDKAAFERETFVGSRTRPKFARFELVTGGILAESYDAIGQQLTFTTRLCDGSTTRQQLVRQRGILCRLDRRRTAWPGCRSNAPASR